MADRLGVGEASSEDVHVLAIVKGEERYVFLIPNNREDRAESLRAMGRLASNKDLSFSWYDAAVLSQKVRSIPLPTEPTT